MLKLHSDAVAFPMKVSMSCPSCGGRSSEYEENKWRCQHCSGTFLYEPAPAPVTNIQQIYNVSGSAAHAQLDPGRAVYDEPMYSDFGHQSARDNLARSHESWGALYFRLAMFGAGSVICYVIFKNTPVPKGPALLEPLVGLSSIAASLVFAFKFLAVLFGEMPEQRKLEAGYKETLAKPRPLLRRVPKCPYCAATVEVKEKAFSHCLSCGKRFYHADEKTFPLLGVS